MLSSIDSGSNPLGLRALRESCGMATVIVLADFRGQLWPRAWRLALEGEEVARGKERYSPKPLLNRGECPRATCSKDHIDAGVMLEEMRDGR